MTITARNGLIFQTDLDAFWTPFAFDPASDQSRRVLSRASDMHYYTPDGRAILDATSGAFSANAGHCRAPIVNAVRAQAGDLELAPLHFAHQNAIALANRIAALAPSDLTHVYFANSRTDAVETALKIALAYHNLRGEGARQRLIGRDAAYHGDGFAGAAIGGIAAHRKLFGTVFAGVDHLPSTYNRDRQAFTKGEPEWGAHLADELERIVGLHDCSTIAAVIVAPGVSPTDILPPPVGYLKRLRAICDKYDILLIFDGSQNSFGRLGYAFAAERYDVLPDMITFGNCVTSGMMPMGGVLVRDPIYNTFVRGPNDTVLVDRSYPISANPVACAAALAALDIYEKEDLFARALRLERIWADAVHSLKGLPNILDIRSVGLCAAIDLAQKPDARGKRGFAAMNCAFHDFDLLLHAAGDTLILMPPLIVSPAQIDEIVDKTARAIKAVA
jgi:beta-alanine--pyruvate transaminase